MVNTRYIILDSFKDLKKLVNACIKTGYACVDFETTGTDLFRDSFLPTILSVTFQPGSSVIIPLAHPESPFKKRWEEYLIYFGKRIIENPEVVKIGWNWKFEAKIFKKYGINYRGTVIDGMLAKYVLNEERPSDLKSMVSRYLPEFSGYEKSNGFDRIPWDKKPFLPLCEYSAIDTDATFRLSIFFEKRIIEAGLYNLFRNLIMPASRVLQSVEYRGLNFDTQLNLDLHDKYEKLIAEKYKEFFTIRKVNRYNKKIKTERINSYIDGLEEEIVELKNSKSSPKTIKNREDKILRILSGNFTTKNELKLVEDINFGSVKQLIELMFNSSYGFKFPILDRTETGEPSTGEETILKLRKYDKHGFIKMLLDYRGLQHAYSTFIKGYRDLIQEDGKIHGSFNIHMTVTGRLSSKEPNLQQIPKKEVNPDIKPQFITPPGQLFLSFDYSQAELRVLAYLAKDKNMVQWFREGKDIHLASACKKYHVEYDDILKIYSDEMHPEYTTWKMRRKNAKITNFGAVYGVTAPKLAINLSTDDHKVEAPEAQDFLDDFFIIFSGIGKYMKKQIKKMEEDGFVTSLFGRKRRCPDIYSDFYPKYLEASRQSYNAPSQSTASDFALFATVLLHYMVKKGELPMINEVSTVHDSVYTYTFPEFINPWTIYQLNKLFKNPETKKYFGFEVKEPQMLMDFSVGRNMLEEFPYTPGYDYRKMLEPGFTKEAYFEEHKKVKGYLIDDYPEHFPEYFTKEFETKFKNKWIKKFNSL